MTTKDILHIALFAALTSIGAFIRIPFALSSFTLQFFFTAMAGVLLGAKKGALSQLVYVALGLMGLPIFTSGGGFGYVVYPTFGFLLGLIPAAWVVGKLTQKQQTMFRVMLACTVGLAVLYLIGMPYMALILNVYMGKDMNIGAICMAGMIPFLPGDAAKIAGTAFLSRKLLPRIKQSL